MSNELVKFVNAVREAEEAARLVAFRRNDPRWFAVQNALARVRDTAGRIDNVFHGPIIQH